MKFDSVNQLMFWYFNKFWLVPPKMPGNHSMHYSSGSSSKKINPLVIYPLVNTLRIILSEKLTPRELLIIETMFTRGASVSELSLRIKRTERRIRQIRNAVLEKIRRECEAAGILDSCSRYYDAFKVPGQRE